MYPSGSVREVRAGDGKPIPSNFRRHVTNYHSVIDADVAAGLAALAAEMPRCDAERHGGELYGAPRFSVFSLFDNKETTLSRILADLLNPRGSHGQGTLFLSQLMCEVGSTPISRSSSKFVSVRTEAPVPVSGRESNRRLDILIETRTDVIGIENKKWTGEGQNQLSDYWEYVKARAQEFGKRPSLVFVSDDVPTVKEAIRLPYFAVDGEPSVDRLLGMAEPQIRAFRVKDFVADFRNWIAQMFGGREPMTGIQSYQETVTAALLDPQGAKAIGAILASGELVRRSVVEDIEKRLRQDLSAAFRDMQFGPPHGVSSLFQAVSQKNVGLHAYRDSWPKNCVLCIENEGPGFQNIGYGVVALDPDTDEGRESKNIPRVSERIALLNEAVRVVPGGGRPWPWWRWERSAAVSNWSISALANELIEGGKKTEAFFSADLISSDLVALAQAISRVTQGDSSE